MRKSKPIWPSLEQEHQEAGGVVVRPQAGPQEKFLSSPADIAIFGGAAFSGKTYALLMDALRHLDDGTVSAVIFRRESTQVLNPGGLWDESVPLYAPFGPNSVAGKLEHRFPSGFRVRFAHLEHEQSVYGWDGAQVPIIGFDQLEHFTQHQFFYLLSRNRCPSGTVRSYIRATCNPDPDSWLASFISWWINQETGFPIPERGGVLRWFVRNGNTTVWADTAEELKARNKEDLPKSVTFIPGNIYDNVIGMQRDPEYLGHLKALNAVERARLLGGNWKIRPAAGLLFRREWCRVLDVVPGDLESIVRYWDLAATPKTELTDPAWTVGVKLGRYRKLARNDPYRYVILDVRRMRESPHKVQAAMRNIALADGTHVRVGIPQDPGQAGKDQVSNIVGKLAGFDVRYRLESGDKVARFGPFSAQCEAGNVDYVVGEWNDDYLSSLEGFPDGKVKDDADASSGAFREILLFGGVDLRSGSAVAEESVVADSGSPWNLAA